VGRLAGGVAHDFNNLLTAILGYAEIALTDPEGLNPSQREALVEIGKAGERARDLMRQLLAFGRKQALAVTVVDLNDVIDGFGKMLKRLIGEDIHVVSVLDPAIGLVKADPAQIEQILLNLAVNSRDAMPDGGKLTFETMDVVLDDTYHATHMEVEPGSYVMLAVSDTGYGMDSETLKSIFEPFFTTKERGKGTGLGLATVYGIVKQHGGHITVYSETGRGTTFKIYLPRISKDGQKDTTLSTPAPSPGGTETILVVEDDAPVRRLTCTVLTGLGYDVIEAQNGAEAVRLAKDSETIHLLVTDVIMPGMSGREVSEHLATLHPRIKILYVSGYTADVIGYHGVLDTGIHFLQKPFTVLALANKVREVFAT
jgi:CheY-like chemotaxis protein